MEGYLESIRVPVAETGFLILLRVRVELGSQQKSIARLSDFQVGGRTDM